MSRTLGNARVLTPEGVVEGWVEVARGTITAIGAGRPRSPDAEDLGGVWLAPGFVDIHAHGGGGASFQQGDPHQTARVAAFHRSHGTTTMLASLVTSPLPHMLASTRRLGQLAEAGVIAGVHLEGPFLSAARCGAHSPKFLRDPHPADVDALLSAGAGRVAMVTLAPEREDGLDAIRRIVGSGAVAAIGHTDADHSITLRAVDAGVRVATHLFNGMPPLHHRSPGPALALMADPRVTVELINDGVHVHPYLVRHVLNSIGAARVALVSDAIAATGIGDGELQVGELRVVVRNGEPWLADGSSLAGSTLTLDVAVRNAVSAGVEVPDAVRAASATPADAAGLGARAGRIRVGAPADLVVLDDRLHVRRVMVAGIWQVRR